MMICNFCKKEYERETQTVKMFGSVFCLHDDKLDHFRSVGKVRTDVLDVKLEKYGKNIAERKYIHTARSSGDSVVRGSDGLLRRIGEDNTCEE